MIAKSISRVLIFSALSLGGLSAVVPIARAESTPFTVIRANDSYFCRNKNQCTATIEAQNGDRYRINYGGALTVSDGDRILVETQAGRTWNRIRHAETGETARILNQRPL